MDRQENRLTDKMTRNDVNEQLGDVEREFHNETRCHNENAFGASQVLFHLFSGRLKKRAFPFVLNPHHTENFARNRLTPPRAR
jgi:hypothetical protein